MLLIGESSEFDFIFNVSSRRPHLNYILFSNVYSFELPQKMSPNLLEYPIYQQRTNRSESLECAKFFFFSKLIAIFYFCEIHCKPLTDLNM